MPSEIKARNGQSLYDLCLMTYGTLNKMGQFCKENSVSDVNYLPKSGETFIYQPEQVFNQQQQGIMQATGYLTDNLVSLPTGFEYTLDFTF